MGWRRLGLVYAPQGETEWLVSHASVPFAEPLQGSLCRFWFSPMDGRNRSHIAWIVVDLSRPQEILERSPGPVLGCGPAGAFDDCGAMMSWLADGRLYYIGWNTRSTVPYQVSIGLAEADGDGWRRVEGPILERSPSDPWFCSNPCVLPDGEGWRMWYLSGLGWNEIGDQWSPSYRICAAVSEDGRDWTGQGQAAIDLQGDEYALARPSVLRTEAEWLMWFCARTRTRPYRLAAARSEDGVTWTRAPELAGLEPAPHGWDSEMIAYPHVFEQAGARWMLYCGNGFGRSGFGLAVWD